MYPTDEETALWVALNLAQRSAHSMMNSALKAQGMPRLNWYDVLWAIERTGSKGLRPFEVEKSLIFEQSNLSRLLRRMIEEGLVAESVCPEDHRGRVLRVSAKGRKVRKQMWKFYGPMIHEHVSRIPRRSGLAEITTALESLIEQQE